MGKDRLVYTVRNISSSCIFEINKWQKVYKPGTKTKETSLKSKSNIGHPFYCYGIYRIKEGLVDLQFMQYSKYYGDLKISVNIPMMYHGNATTPKSDTPSKELESIIFKEIKEVCNTLLLPEIGSWSVTKDETNVDIIGKKEDIDALFEVLIKTKVPRYKRDDSYADCGTIYFYTGSNRENSHSVICIYYKSDELEKKNEIFNDGGYVLQPDESCLRLEIRNRKGPLKTACKKAQKRFNTDLNQSICEMVVGEEFQICTLEDLVFAFKLDRVFLPKTELMEMIEKSSLTKKVKETCKRYIEYENGVGNFSKSSCQRYKALMRTLGYAPIYSSKKLNVNLVNIHELIKEEKSYYWTNDFQ